MENLFRTIEHNPQPQKAQITGSFPEWVEGQLFRLGPAKWDLDDGFSMNHWLDGCALMYKFTIKKGHVDVMSRFLDTVAFQKLTQVKRPVYTEFGTKSFPDPCKNVFSRYFSQLVPLELTDNVIGNVYTVDDELYASSETSLLWKINQKDLKCVKRTDLKEILSVNLASSHPHKCLDGAIYNLGASFMSGLKYHIMKLPPSQEISQDGKVGFERSSILTTISSNHKTSFSYYHSFGLTEHYVLFLEQPLLVNTVRMAASGIKGYSLKECFDWCPKEKTRFHLIDRVSGQELKVKFQSEAFFFFHHVNTYEDDGHIVADIMAFPGPEVMDKFYLNKLRLGQFDTTCQPVLTRYVLPLKTDGKKGTNLVTLKNTRATAVKQDNGVVILEGETIGDQGYEMPTINYSMFNTRKYRYVYGSGVFETGKYKNSLIKLDNITGDMIVWKEKETMYPGELIYVPRPGSTEEDDGVLLCVVLDVEPDSPDFLMVLDAKTFKELGRAVVPNSIQLPPTVHGCFLFDK
ncbi:beta,beta-carotene 15,15'-dioxygenase-like [Uloborus diversus]|uniref:beta,beta-carotene 15,15'-dioxygenase-like n=1 Tax=Uloborus diversus TaxID=327109 RepID=UPI0024091D17|nr:beta,beta-carotene 15,15'-dioxygenase-like [Uloborus diversus]